MLCVSMMGVRLWLVRVEKSSRERIICFSYGSTSNWEEPKRMSPILLWGNLKLWLPGHWDLSINPLRICCRSYTRRQMAFSHTTPNGHQVSSEETFFLEMRRNVVLVCGVETVSQPATLVAVHTYPSRRNGRIHSSVIHAII